MRWTSKERNVVGMNEMFGKLTEIVAPFKIPLDAQLRSAIAASLLSHILYARNQTPM